MRRSDLWPLAACLVCLTGLPAASASADTVTLPVVASVVGIAPFYSDVRAFNTSYSAVVDVTAVYRCFTCGSNPPMRVFSLGARESRPFDDIAVSLFGTPNSVGPVEFTSAGSGLVVTSRLYSPFAGAGGGSVGMFIPGLPSSAAKPVTVLTNLANGAYRTNVGVYNPNSSPVVATARVYSSPGSILLGTVTLSLAPKNGAQISNIYQTVGLASLVTTNGYCVIESDSPANPLFTYAATADNATQDPTFAVGAEDVQAPSGFNPPTATPAGGPAATPTPTPTAPPTTTLKRGVFTGQNGYTTAGSVQILRDASGNESVRLGSDFRVSIGPGTISVWLARSNARIDPTNSQNVKVGTLTTQFSGEFTFPIPAPGSSGFTHVVTFCDAARVNFGFAQLQDP